MSEDLDDSVNIHAIGTKLYLHVPEDKEASHNFDLGDLMLLAFFARANEDTEWGEELLAWFRNNEVMDEAYSNVTLH